MSGLCGDTRDLLSSNVRLREQRDLMRAAAASSRAELETVTARLAKVEAEAEVLYGLLCNANQAAWAQVDATAPALARAREILGPDFHVQAVTRRGGE